MDGEVFPAGFFERDDPSLDEVFYRRARFVVHLDRRAVVAVGALYEDLGVAGTVVDVMSSWVSHFRSTPGALVGIGMNAEELAANSQLTSWHVADLNAVPRLPLQTASADHAVCCVSVDYLTNPTEVFSDVARVVRPGGLFVQTFSNRCFPAKVIRGWLAATEDERPELVRLYFALAEGWEPAEWAQLLGAGGDPLWAVWARRRQPTEDGRQSPGRLA